VAHHVPLSQRAEWAAGQPISDLMSRALANPDLISLAAGFVDQQTLPVEPARVALDALLARQDDGLAALQYGTTPGFPPLRDFVLQRFLQADGVTAAESPLNVEQTVVTAGSNQLLHLVAESLLDPGDIVLCAAPSYFVFLGTLANVGARSVGVAADEHGMIPEALEEELKRLENAGQLGRVKLIYVVTYWDNPAGTTMPADRRARIVELAKRWSKAGKIHVISDAAYRELRYFGDDIPSLLSFDNEGDTVIATETISKSFSPGIRLGWGFLPTHLVDPVCNQKGNIDFGSPNFSQHLMAKVFEMGLFEPHVERIRQNYRIKLQAMLDAADELLGPIDGVTWVRPTGGLYVWLQLPDSVDTGPDGTLFDLATSEGVLYVPGEYCYPAEGESVRKNTIRLSFGVQSTEKIQAGMVALARAIRLTLEVRG
jgi:2-aminoadipate transaminase